MSGTRVDRCLVAGSVSVSDTETDTVIDTVPVGFNPFGGVA
jgi:YVTN family beta-propeller protein